MMISREWESYRKVLDISKTKLKPKLIYCVILFFSVRMAYDSWIILVEEHGSLYVLLGEYGSYIILLAAFFFLRFRYIHWLTILLAVPECFLILMKFYLFFVIGGDFIGNPIIQDIVYKLTVALLFWIPVILFSFALARAQNDAENTKDQAAHFVVLKLGSG